MSIFLNTYFALMLEQTLPLTALILALLTVSPFIKKSCAAKWRYFMWLFVALRLLLPFRTRLFSAPITMELPQQIQGVPVMAATPDAAAAHISLQSVLALIWLLGTAVFATYQLFCYISFKHMVKRWAVSVRNEETLKLFYKTKTAMKIRSGLEIKLCPAVSTPMIFGFFKPVLLLPSEDFNAGALEVIFRHELIHFKRKDIWYKLTLTAANAVNWFNPAVYIMAKAADRDIELACDAEVVKEQGMEYRRNYCRAILSVVHSGHTSTPPLSTCFIISKKALSERFGDILDLKKKKRGILLFAAVVLSAVLCGGLVTFATEKTADVLENDLNIIEPPTPKPSVPPIETPAPAYTEAPQTAPVSMASMTTSAPSGTLKNKTNFKEPSAQPQTPQITPIPQQPEETAHTEPTPIPDYGTQIEYVQSVVDLGEKSAEMDIRFNEENKSYSSSNAFYASPGAEMVVASDSAVKLQVVDNYTGEVVREENVAAGGGISVPGGEYTINASSDSGGDASLYIYQKRDDENE